MALIIRNALDPDFHFAYQVKKAALGPYVISQWGWDDAAQMAFHQQRWSEKPWSILNVEGIDIGTLSVQLRQDQIRFGEFYILPSHQNRGIGSEVLAKHQELAQQLQLPIVLEYLKWNPVGALYKRFGFQITHETEWHYYMELKPRTGS